MCSAHGARPWHLVTTLPISGWRLRPYSLDYADFCNRCQGRKREDRTLQWNGGQSMRRVGVAPPCEEVLSACRCGKRTCIVRVPLPLSYHTQSIENGRRALAEARVPSAEIGAAWDYIDAVQPQINRATGETSGVYCAVAAKDIAAASLQICLFDWAIFAKVPVTPKMPLIASSARRLPSSRRASLKSTTGLSIKEIARSSAMWACLKWRRDVCRAMAIRRARRTLQVMRKRA